jgi:hypothetical protein
MMCRGRIIPANHPVTNINEKDRSFGSGLSMLIPIIILIRLRRTPERPC